jgi:hypothetical protein
MARLSGTTYLRFSEWRARRDLSGVRGTIQTHSEGPHCPPPQADTRLRFSSARKLVCLLRSILAPFAVACARLATRNDSN